MEVRKIRMSGVEVYVQVEGAGEPTGDLELTSRISTSILDAGEEVRNILRAVSTSVQDAFQGTAPDEWGIELMLGFKGETGVPFVAKGEANGSVKVSVKWKKA